MAVLGRPHEVSVPPRGCERCSMLCGNLAARLRWPALAIRSASALAALASKKDAPVSIASGCSNVEYRMPSTSLASGWASSLSREETLVGYLWARLGVRPGAAAAHFPLHCAGKSHGWRTAIRLRPSSTATCVYRKACAPHLPLAPTQAGLLHGRSALGLRGWLHQ